MQYIAFFKGIMSNEKQMFTVESNDIRTANKLAREKVKEIVSGSELILSAMELVRVDERSDRIYSNGMGQTFSVTDVKL